MRIPPPRPWLAPAIILAATLSLPAITINLTYATDGQAGSVPAEDPDGSLLMAICQAAADYWEDIMEDPHTLNLKVRYNNDPNAVSGIGNWDETAESGGRATDGIIQFKGTTNWFYDPTPDDHGEYNLQQTLVRNLSTTTRTSTYGGLPPEVLEASFSGALSSNAPDEASGAVDLYSVALHEIGHGLGMSAQLSTCNDEIADGDFDVFSTLANGAIFDVKVNTTGGAHTVCANCLMNPSIGSNRRVLPSATDVLALATGPSPAWATIDLPRQDFLPGGTSDWNTASNWVGNQVPQNGDDASCRHGVELGGADIELSANAFVKNLFVSSATDVETNAFKLDVVESVTIQYDFADPRASIFVEAGGELEAGEVEINGGELGMLGGLADIEDLLWTRDNSQGTGEISGYGSIDVAGTLDNDGRIRANYFGSNTLTFTSTAPAPWDLDGSEAGEPGEVLANAGNLNFASGAVADPFDGTMQVGDPYVITIAEPWSLGPDGLIDLNGGTPDYATLSGGLLTTAGGELECSQNCRITCPVDLGGTLQATVFGSGNLQVDGASTISGGTYVLNNSALMSLNGSHILEGGSFVGNGTLRFGGATTINAPVTIDCETVNLDGAGIATKTVTINSSLTINSPNIDSSGAANTFDSTLNFNTIAPNPARLIMNGPASWTMAGTMNFSVPAGSFGLIDGAPFTMSGTSNVTGEAVWRALTTITGVVNLDNADDRLSFDGNTGLNDENPYRIEGGVVNGPGALKSYQSAVTGFGQVTADIDFNSRTSLRADDGTLILAGSFRNVPTHIGTADNDGVLNITQAWTLPNPQTLSLRGGSVTGGQITNQNRISGFGTVAVSQVVNEDEISANDGQTLVIDTFLAPDLDGTGTPAELITRTLNAVEGDLTIVDAPLDAFDGTATIAPGRTMNFAGGWELGATGVLHMTGDTATSRATLLGPDSVISGSLHIDDQARFGGPASFANGCQVTLADPDDLLFLGADGSIRPGASFSGSGELINTSASTLTLRNGANVGIPVRNDGEVELDPSLFGTSATASVQAYEQTASGTLQLRISDLPRGFEWDVLNVTGHADLRGTLEVIVDIPGVKAGDTWKIVNAGSVNANSLNLTASGVPPGMVLLLLPAIDGVYVKLATNGIYKDWAIAAGIPDADRGFSADPDGDLIPNSLELFLDGDPLVPERNLLPPPYLLSLGGKEYLAITVPVSTKFVPTDLNLGVFWSGELVDWFESQVWLQERSFDPVDCIDYRVYRTRIPVGDEYPHGFLRLEAAP